MSSSSSEPRVGRSAAGIVVRGGRVLVGRRKPGGDLGGRWEFPGGKLEPGETAEGALAREYQEELGVEAEALGRLGRSSFEHRGRPYELVAVALCVSGDEFAPREHDEFRWAAAEELVALDLAESDRSLLPFVLPLLSPR